MPANLDGIRPRNAVCTHCGYHLGGVPITQGHITCPECGKPVVFALMPPRQSPRLKVFAAAVTVLFLIALVMAVWENVHTTAAIALALAIATLWLLLRRVRRWSGID
jgi:hypothetical protein